MRAGVRVVIDFEVWERVPSEPRGLAMRLAKDWELLDELSSDSVRCCCVDRAAGDALSTPAEESLADDRPVAQGT